MFDCRVLSLFETVPGGRAYITKCVTKKETVKRYKSYESKRFVKNMR